MLTQNLWRQSSQNISLCLSVATHYPAHEESWQNVTACWRRSTRSRRNQRKYTHSPTYESPRHVREILVVRSQLTTGWLNTHTRTHAHRHKYKNTEKFTHTHTHTHTTFSIEVSLNRNNGGTETGRLPSQTHTHAHIKTLRTSFPDVLAGAEAWHVRVG